MNRKKLFLASAAALLALVGPAGCGESAPQRDQRELVVAPTIPADVRRNIDALFNNREAMGETRALLILKDGRPIYEAYGPGFGPDSRLISWSMAKSITAVLMGIMVADGRLALDDPAPVEAWQRTGDPRGAITLRNLLHMASGLEHVETNDPPWEADTVRMLFGEGAQNMAAFAEAKPPVAQPDEQFNYSTATSVILSDILTHALTENPAPIARRTAMLNLVQARFAAPLGMSSLKVEFDANGTLIGGSIMHATARDYARFGEFLRRRGATPDGRRLVPESWINFMLTPSPADGGYGGHIWLNRPRPAGSNEALWPEQGPADLFACLGHQGQYIIVSPSQRLTVVRLGVTDEQTERPNVRAALRDIIAAL